MVDKVTPNAFERHAQTALVLLLVALLLWVGGQTQRTAVSVAELRVEIAFMKAAIQKPDVDHNQMHATIADLRARMLLLESRNSEPE